jgi:hypothetical protein
LALLLRTRHHSFFPHSFFVVIAFHSGAERDAL